MKILESGFVPTPKESVLYGYPISHPKEVQFVICAKEVSSMYDDLASGSRVGLDSPSLLSQKDFFPAVRRANLRLGFATTYNNLSAASGFLFKAIVSAVGIVAPRLISIVRKILE